MTYWLWSSRTARRTPFLTKVSDDVLVQILAYGDLGALGTLATNRRSASQLRDLAIDKWVRQRLFVERAKLAVLSGGRVHLLLDTLWVSTPAPHDDVLFVARAGRSLVAITARSETLAFDPSTWRYRRLPGPAVDATAACTAWRDGVFLAHRDAAFWFDGLTWTPLPAPPRPVDRASCSVVDDAVYVAGGPWLQCFADGVWALRAPLPAPLWESVAATHDRRLFVLAGKAEPEAARVGAVYVYDPCCDAWSSSPALPLRRRVASLAFNDRLFVFDATKTASSRRFDDDDDDEAPVGPSLCLDEPKFQWRTLDAVLHPSKLRLADNLLAATTGGALPFLPPVDDDAPLAYFPTTDLRRAPAPPLQAVIDLT